MSAPARSQVRQGGHASANASAVIAGFMACLLVGAHFGGWAGFALFGFLVAMWK